MTAEDVSTESAGLRRLVGIGQETWRSFSGDRATRLGASLAYYSIFALAPLLFLAIWLAGLIIGQETAQADLESRLESTLGSDIAAALSQLISEESSPALTSTLPVLSFVVLVVAASVLFGAWRDVLNVIFDVPWRRGLKATLRRKIVAFGLVGLFGATAFAMALAQSIILSIETRTDIEVLDAGFKVLTAVGPYVAGTILLAFMYRYAPDVIFDWREVWLGTIPAALAFALGTWLYGLYLGSIAQVTATSVAGAVFLLLAWIYYSAQILLFGAELIKTLDAFRTAGSRPVVPVK